MEEENTYDSDQDDSQSSSGSSLQSWISWFCSLEGHDFYVEIPEDFIEDEFNLTGLSAIVPHYIQSLEMILDMECGEYFDDDEEQEEYESTQTEHKTTEGIIEEDDFWKGDDAIPKRQKAIDPKMAERYAFMLYGLIHSRYLLTKNGLRLMAERYSNSGFGVCPRYYCEQSPVLPIGRHDEPDRESVQLYCPRCLDVYNPPNSIHRRVDGAHFGSTYSHLLFLTYPKLVLSPRSYIYQPRIFGFKVNQRSLSGPQNQWLRMRPPEIIDDYEEEEDVEEEGVEEEQVIVIENEVDRLSSRTRNIQINYYN